MLIDRQDVLYAIRSARRTPLLTFVAVLALSVGIGLNAGVFAILNFYFLVLQQRKILPALSRSIPAIKAGISDRPETLPSTQKTTTRFKPRRAHSPMWRHGKRLPPHSTTYAGQAVARSSLPVTTFAFSGSIVRSWAAFSIPMSARREPRCKLPCSASISGETIILPTHT